MAPLAAAVAYDHLLEALPITPKEILRFRFPADAQRRFSELVERNRQGKLTPDETIELERYLSAEAVVRILKAKALRLTRSDK